MPFASRSSRNWRAARMGPTVWELEGPTPILKMSKTLTDMLGSVFLEGQQASVAAYGRGIDGHGAFRGEAQHVVRTAGLGAGARETLAAEGLHAHHRTDHVAVDVDVAHADALLDVLGLA